MWFGACGDMTTEATDGDVEQFLLINEATSGVEAVVTPDVPSRDGLFKTFGTDKQDAVVVTLGCKKIL